MSAVQRRERPGSADPNAGSWSGTGGPGGSASLVPVAGASAGLAASSRSGTGAPSTSDWGDWDSGAATGRTVSEASGGGDAPRTYVFPLTDLRPAQPDGRRRRRRPLAPMGALGGHLRTRMCVVYVSAVRTPTGNTFSASVLVLRKTLFTRRALKHRSRLLRAILDCLSLGTFRI